MPADSIIHSLSNIMPDAILISVTLEDNIQIAKSLARKIRTGFTSLPIFVGGLAFNDANKISGFDTINNNTIVIRNVALIDAIRIIRSKIMTTSYA